MTYQRYATQRQTDRIIAQHDISNVCYSEAERIIAEHEVSKVCYVRDRQTES